MLFRSKAIIQLAKLILALVYISANFCNYFFFVEFGSQALNSLFVESGGGMIDLFEEINKIVVAFPLDIGQFGLGSPINKNFKRLNF